MPSETQQRHSRWLNADGGQRKPPSPIGASQRVCAGEKAPPNPRANPVQPRIVVRKEDQEDMVEFYRCSEGTRRAIIEPKSLSPSRRAAWFWGSQD
jgi:hypothetical protein